MRYRILISVTICLLACVSAAFASELALVVNKSNSTVVLTEEEARNIFLGKKTTWESGKRIVVVTQDNAEVHEFFTKNYVNKTPQQFALFWKKALFTGTGIPPQNVRGDADVKSFVASTPEAIGYIALQSVDGTIKALAVK